MGSQGAAKRNTPRRRGDRRRQRQKPDGSRLGATHPVWIAGVLLLGGILYAAADQGTGLLPWHRLEVEVTQAQARVRAQRVRNAQLAAEIRDLKSSPEALEAAIRDVTGWVRPGELRVDVAAAPGALPAPPPHR